MVRLTLCIYVVVLLSTSQGRQDRPRPHRRAVCSNDEVGKFAVDRRNMCWYHECIPYGTESRFIPRRCAPGSKVSYNFIQGYSNPCTVNLNDGGYGCERMRASVDGPPKCFKDENYRYECYNGGVYIYESDKCWCDCPKEWRGDFDCSKRSRVNAQQPIESSGLLCEPSKDWCAIAGGCLNGGVCYNQCESFRCDCPDSTNRVYYGNRCGRTPEDL